MHEDPNQNQVLFEERNWLESLLIFHAEIGDLGLGGGQADIAYERDGRRWELTLRAADDE